jgi:hypothetical protein
MSTDYRIHVKRKSDNKEIAVFHANIIKNLLDSPHASTIHCSGYSVDKSKFTYEELNNLSEIIYKDFELQYQKLDKLSMMLCCAKTDKAIEDIKSDIQYTKEYINDELKWQLYGVYNLIGHIQCCTENLYDKKDNAAYMYNAKDLNEPGKDHNTIWSDDVYCEIETC